MASNVKKISQKMKDSSVSSQNESTLLRYFRLKMVNDKKTEMYVKFAKVMIIAQGCYTDVRDKTFKDLKKLFKYTSCILSDESFKNCGKFCLPETTEEFYEYLKYYSKKGLEEGNNLIVIDSTMSNVEQNQYYIALAYKMQYVILVVPPVAINVSNSMWPKHSFASSFGTEAATYIHPVNMFQHLFCAWYFHDSDSHQLRSEVSLYIQDCLDGIPGFYNIMHKNCRTLDDEEGQNGKKNLDSEEMQLIDAIKHYYNLNDKRQDLAYCAVKVIGSSMKAMNEYFKKDIVLSNYGKMSKLLIVGFIITPYILAARVKLTRNQVDLWEMEDLLDESTAKQHNFIGPLSLLQESKQKLPDVEVQLISSKSNPTLVSTAKSVEDPLKIIPYFARGKACNIVLGKVKNAPTYQVDYGVQFALNMEAKTLNATANLDITELDNCIVKRIGKYWFVYLKEMLQIDGFFSSCVKPLPFDDPIKL